MNRCVHIVIGVSPVGTKKPPHIAKSEIGVFSPQNSKQKLLKEEATTDYWLWQPQSTKTIFPQWAKAKNNFAHSDFLSFFK